MTFVDKLLIYNKKYIVSSIYQNTVYNNKPLYEYFGEKKKTNKKGKTFESLLNKMLSDVIPSFDIKYTKMSLGDCIKYEKCFLKHFNRYISINELYEYIRMSNGDFIVVLPPSFFCRKYQVVCYDVNGIQKYIEYVSLDDSIKDSRIKLYNRYFKHITMDNVNEIFCNSTIEEHIELKKGFL